MEPAQQAAPRPATVTTIVNVTADSPVSGAASTATNPPSIPPRVQVMAARRSGTTRASAPAARSFWALALMAETDTRVYRVHAHRPKVMTSVIPTR